MTYIRHAKVSGAGPAADPSKVGGDDWDDDHVWVGGLQKATVTLSSADILDLHNTPITLVAAPGAGKTVIPILFIPSSGTGTTPYTVVDYTGVVVGGANLGAPTWVEELGSLTSGPGLTSVKKPQDVNAIVNSTWDDKGLVIYSQDGNAFTDGDFPLSITVWYFVQDLP